MRAGRSLLAAAGAAAGLACGGGDPPPAELFQVWRNPNPAYAGRTFELREDVLVFGTGPGSPVVHRVASIETQSGDDPHLYTVRYVAVDGSRVPLHLAFTPGPGPRLRIGASRDLWQPAAPEDAAP